MVIVTYKNRLNTYRSAEIDISDIKTVSEELQRRDTQNNWMIFVGPSKKKLKKYTSTQTTSSIDKIYEMIERDNEVVNAVIDNTLPKIELNNPTEQSLLNFGFIKINDHYCLTTFLVSDVSFNLSINLNEQKFEVDILDENICQPYPLSSINPNATSITREIFYNLNNTLNLLIEANIFKQTGTINL